MAEKFDEPVFWLPSEFLTDEEDLFLDYKKTESFNKKLDHDFSFGLFDNSGFSSRVDSVQSDDDEFSIFCSDQKPNVWKSKNLSGWGLPNSASEEIERMRKVNETMAFYSNKIFAPTQKPNPVTGSLKNMNTRTGFYPNRSDILLLQLQARQVQILNQQRMINNRIAQRKMGFQPTLKGQTGSGVIKPGLFGETGVKKERTGTGVFIPRGSGIGITNVTKKQDCNKVVSNHDSNKPTTSEYEAALKRRNFAILAQQQQRRNLMLSKQMMNQEVSEINIGDLEVTN